MTLRKSVFVQLRQIVVAGKDWVSDTCCHAEGRTMTLRKSVFVQLRQIVVTGDGSEVWWRLRNRRTGPVVSIPCSV
jgi:hypothetical protein